MRRWGGTRRGEFGVGGCTTSIYILIYIGLVVFLFWIFVSLLFMEGMEMGKGGKGEKRYIPGIPIFKHISHFLYITF